MTLDVRLLPDGRTRVTVQGEEIRGESEKTIAGWMLGPRDDAWDHHPSVINRFRFHGPISVSDKRRVGQVIADLLLPDAVHVLITKTLWDEGARRLALVVNLHDRNLAAVPWELVRVRANPDKDLMLELVDAGHTLVRRARYSNSQPEASLGDVSRRILLVRGPDLEGRPKLPHGTDDHLKEVTEESALGFDVRLLDGPSVDELREALDEFQPGIVHFAAHGVADGTAIHLRDRRLPSSTLVEWIVKHRVQIVVLSVCRSASWSQSAPVGLATDLIERGITAVVAMRTDVDDSDAARFTSALYAGLVAGMPIEWCVADARPKMGDDWASAVLYLSPESFALSPAQAPAARCPSWVQIDALGVRRRLLLSGDGPVAVNADEGSDIVPAGFGGDGEMVVSPNGRALAWRLGSTVRCAWMSESKSGIRVTEWPERFELSALGTPDLLAVAQRGDLAVQCVVSTDEATHLVTLHRGGRFELNQLYGAPSISACFVRHRPCTVDTNGRVREAPVSAILEGFAPVSSLDAAVTGVGTSVVALAGPRGRTVVCCELTAGRVTDFDAAADRVIIERPLRPYPEPWSVLVSAGRSASRHVVR